MFDIHYEFLLNKVVTTCPSILLTTVNEVVSPSERFRSRGLSLYPMAHNSRSERETLSKVAVPHFEGFIYTFLNMKMEHLRFLRKYWNY